MTRSRRTERRILAVASLALLAFATSACALTPDPAEKSPRRQSRSFAIPAEALRAEPIRFELDVPYDGGENARRRLDLYRPEKPASCSLPVIVFIRGGGWANKASDLRFATRGTNAPDKRVNIFGLRVARDLR